MRTIIINCDICKKEIPQDKSHQAAPRPLRIETFCESQNPMARISGGHQVNVFSADDVCVSCMKYLAERFACAIETRMSEK